jgi:menaquinone-dependent protoporphyrinogen oxidase
MKALVIYGTRSGATKKIADEIGKVLGEQGFSMTVENAAKSGGIDVNSYDLVVVGSSVWALAWKRQATDFVKRNRKALAGKKVALFWSGWAGDDPVDPDIIDMSMAKVTDAFPSIKPLEKAYFGSYTSFDSWNPIARIACNSMKKEFEKKGIDTSEPVDRRDWNAIRQWAADVAAKARPTGGI